MNTYNIITPMSLYEIADRFKAFDRDKFSLEALQHILDFTEESSGDGIQLDVIGICCDWTECSIETFLNDYDNLFDSDDYTLEEDGEVYYYSKALVEDINEHTYATLLENGNILYINF